MKIPLTVIGHKRLREELERLKNTERGAISRAIGEARAHGDLSENAEYHSAKEKQGMIEARIAELEATLARCQVIDPSAVGADGRCIFGAFVEVQTPDGIRVTYQIVGEQEADFSDGRISATSPVGRALIGKYQGESVSVEAPAGVLEYEIIQIRYSS